MPDALLFDPAFLASLSGVGNWSVGFITTVAILGIAVLGLNVQWGYTGALNFGVAAFLMVGAYTTALITLPPAGDFQAYRFGLELPVWAGWIGGAVAGGVLAFIIGLPTLRLRRDFLAIATIGVAAILRTVANTTEGFVNRARGLNGIPGFLQSDFTPSEYRWVLMITAVTALVLCYLLVRALTDSPWGRVLRAVRDNEATAQAAGKATVPFRMQSFVLGGMLMGFAGALWAHRVGTIAPDAFSDLFGTFFLWTMLIVGGSGNHLGAVVGTLVVGFFWFGTPLIQEELPSGLGSQVFVIRQFVIGLLVVLAVLLMPRGILPERSRVSRWAPAPPGRGWLARLRRRTSPAAE
ncbi:MAG: branched-chain amino acid ABC transporter permease [Chloroflexota bacterium]